MEVFDARRLLIAGGGNLREEQAEVLEDGYWLCPDCFHHMRETLLVVGGDFDKSSHRCWHLDIEEEEEQEEKEEVPTTTPLDSYFISNNKIAES